MSKRYIFSSKPGLAADSVLKGLAQAHMITVTTCAIVVTDDDQVAALLEKLETAEMIETAGGYQDTPAPASETVVPRTAKPAGAKRDKRHYYHTDKPDVECPKCHNKVSAMYMLKDGSQCKICAIKAKKATKSQEGEKSQGQWNSGMPQSDGHHQEHRAELQARPKEKIDLTKLAGKKLG